MGHRLHKSPGRFNRRLDFDVPPDIEDVSVFSNCRYCRFLFRGENILLVLTFISIIGGTVIGMIVPTTGLIINPVLTDEPQLTARQVIYVSFPGQIFLRVLKLMIVPMVIASNISSAYSCRFRATKYFSFLSVLYYSVTSIGAVVIGALVTISMRPGEYMQEPSTNGVTSEQASLSAISTFMDLVRSLIPENIVEATFQRDKYTIFIPNDKINDVVVIANSTNLTTDAHVKLPQLSTSSDKGANILGLIFFSMFFGIGLRKVSLMENEKDVEFVYRFSAGLRKVMVYMVSVIIWTSPIGICSLVAAAVGKTPDFGRSLYQLGYYMITVTSALAIHGFIVLPLLLLILGKRNPVQFLYHMMQALFCAMGTASSVATLPCTINCLENHVQINLKIMRFMLPMATTVNMDGTALYQTATVLYIAQHRGISLSVGDIFMVMFMSIMTSVATASVPSAGFLSMFIDRLRTPLNVYSDAVGIAVVARFCEKKLDPKYFDLENLENQARESVNLQQHNAKQGSVEIFKPINEDPEYLDRIPIKTISNYQKNISKDLSSFIYEPEPKVQLTKLTYPLSASAIHTADLNRDVFYEDDVLDEHASINCNPNIRLSCQYVLKPDEQEEYKDENCVYIIRF